MAGRRLRFSASKFQRPPTGSIPVHQQSGATAHLAVKELHPELLAALGPGLEHFTRADEAVVGAHFQRHRRLQGKRVKQIRQSPFSGLGKDNPLEGLAFQRAQHLAIQALRIARLVQRHIAHPVAAPAQPLGELAHGGEDQNELLLVVANVFGLVHHLGHQDQVGGRVDVAQR